MVQNYDRLVNVFVRPDLRDAIRALKQEKTYDQFLRNLIKNSGKKSQRPDHTSTKSRGAD